MMFHFRLESRFSNRDSNDEGRNKDAPHENELTRKEVESSLGLLDNMSGMCAFEVFLLEFMSNVSVDFSNVQY